MIDDEQLDLWGQKVLKKLDKPDKQKEFEYYKQYLVNLHKRADLDMHSVNLVTGEAGTGKSNFSAISGVTLKQFGFDFDFSTHWCYGHENFSEVVREMTTTERGIFVFDEGIDAGDSRRFMSKVNRVITHMMTKVRKNNHIFFWNIPNMQDLDSRIKNRIATFWIHIIERKQHVDREQDFSRAAFFRKDRNPFIRDKWGFELMEKRYKHKPIHSVDDLNKALFNVRSFACFMRIPRLPKVLEDYYREKSREALKLSGEKGAEELIGKVPSTTI